MSPPSRPALLLLLLVSGLAVHADQKLEIADFKALRGETTALAISNDAKFVLTGEDDGLVALWAVTSGTAPIRSFTGHKSDVFATALLPDGRRGVSCADDNTVIVWDLATGKQLRQMDAGDSIPWVMSCAPDGSLAATGCNDGQIMIWNLADGTRLTTLHHPSPLCSLLFSPDGKTLAAGYQDGQVILWETSHWSQKLALPSADSASVGALNFSADSRLLVTGNQNGAGFVWNVADGSQVCHFAGYDNPETPPRQPVAPVFPGSTITPDNRSSIVFVCLSPDSSTILASIQDATPRFWDAKTGKLLGTADWYEDSRFYIPRFGFTFASAAYTPGRDFIVATKDVLAQVWRASFVPTPIPR